MDGVLETAGLAQFDWHGTTYTLPRPNFGKEALHRVYLQHRERYWIQLQAEYDHPDFPDGKMKPAEYAHHMKDWRSDCVAGKWAFKTPGWYRAINDPECFAEMIFLCLTQIPAQGGISRQEVRKMCQEKQEECDRRREAAFKAIPKDSPEEVKQKLIDEIFATIRSEIVEALDGLLAATPTTAPSREAEGASH